MFTAYNLHQILNEKEFYQWLLERKDKQVGITREGSSCPMANYLNELLTTIPNDDDYVGTVDVSSDYIQINRRGTVYPYIKTDAPEWVKQFVNKVDDLPDLFPVYPDIEYDETGEPLELDPLDMIPVDGKTCIAIMEKIEEDKPESAEQMELEYSLRVY